MLCVGTAIPQFGDRRSRPEKASIWTAARRTFHVPLLPLYYPTLSEIVGLLYGCAHDSVNCHRRLVLHIRHQVAVNVHRNGDRGVTKPFLHHLRMDVVCKQVTRMAVAQLVQRYSPRLQELGNRMRNTTGLRRRTVSQSHHMETLVGADAKLQQFLCLSSAPAAQLLNGEVRKFDRSGSTVLDLLLANGSRVELLCTGDDRKLSTIRSTAFQRRAVISPRRRPRSVARMSVMNIRSSRAASKTLADVGASIVLTGLRSIFGRSRFSRSATGLRAMSFQRSACPSAEKSTRCM